MEKEKYFVLYNEVKIPSVGFGTWRSAPGEETYNAVKFALEAGYRHVDTAYVYGNEKSCGEAIKDSNIDRNEVFIVTKLPADKKGYDICKEYFKKSCEQLGVDYLDLYLIHAPWPWEDVGGDYTKENIETWKAMIDLYNEGKIRAIGVSNFNDEQIKALIEATGFKPMVNQIRFFIGNTQPIITNYCQENDILIEAYSPLATGELVEHPLLVELAKKYNTTIPKICLRYCIEKCALPLPKSVHQERIADNIDFDFKMDKEDIKYLDNIGHIASTRPYRS